MAPGRDSPAPLVTSRNNSDPSPFRLPRAYVQACGKGTLALYYEGSRVVFGSLACGSWSCAHCRKRLAARLLDRLRRGMEARPGQRRTLATLTVDPFKFGAVRIGSSVHPDGRETNLVSEPTPDQFRAAAAAMSAAWNQLNDRLRRKARRAGAETVSYFRVVELHRNGWPHYHVVLEHPTWGPDDLAPQLAGWTLGRTHSATVTLDDAVGELAPYLVCNERKSGGHKAYQFAANALPAGFRLHSSSRGFLAPLAENDQETPVHGVPLRGHFTGYHHAARQMGADTRLALNPPTDADHVPPARSYATGDAAVVYYAALVDQSAMRAPPRWLREAEGVIDSVSRQAERPSQARRVPASDLS